MQIKMMKNKIFILTLVIVNANIFCVANCLAADCKDFSKALEQASIIRGLPIKEQVNCKEVTSDEFNSFVKKASSNEKKESFFSLTEKLYKMIALIPKDYPYAECYEDSSSANINATYHLETKTVFIPKNSSTSFSTLVHEATHALQDQSFNLTQMASKASTTTDSAMTLEAIVEGDSVITERAYKKNNKEKKRKQERKNRKFIHSNTCDLPRALKFQIEFPYYWGTQYLSIKKEKKNKAFNQSFITPPLSTTEIIYPKHTIHQTLGINPFKDNKEFRKYFLNMLPFSAKLKKPSYTDTIGEYSIRCIFREYLTSKDAINGARGWLFDSVSLSEFKDFSKKFFMDWGSSWESEKDAIEFKNAFLNSIAKRDNTKVNTSAKSVILATKEFPFIFVNQVDNKVGIFVSERAM